MKLIIGVVQLVYQERISDQVQARERSSIILSYTTLCRIVTYAHSPDRPIFQYVILSFSSQGNHEPLTPLRAINAIQTPTILSGLGYQFFPGYHKPAGDLHGLLFPRRMMFFAIANPLWVCSDEKQELCEIGRSQLLTLGQHNSVYVSASYWRSQLRRHTRRGLFLAGWSMSSLPLPSMLVKVHSFQSVYLHIPTKKLKVCSLFNILDVKQLPR